MHRIIFLVCFIGVFSQGSSKDFAKSSFMPGDTVPPAAVRQLGEESFFRCEALPDSVFRLMQGKTYKKGCTVKRGELNYLLCLHKDAAGRTLVGEMVVSARIAGDVLDILRQLYRAAYPIERMRLPDNWDADDERQMRANNSSGFNFRYISHTRKVSKHGLGLAVDTNPLYNPYVKRLRDGRTTTEPATATPYRDRSRSFDYKIAKGDLCYRLFKQKGFTWGGDWKSSKDYQHFEK